jgi:formiminoglutamase
VLQSGSHVVCFSVGGSNDQSYPNAAALMNSLGHGKIGVVNIDAHLDVRPLKEGKAHSGSPFRQLLEDVRFSSSIADVDAEGRPQLQFLEFAAQGSQCSRAHADFVTRTHRQRIDWLSDVRLRAAQFPPPALGQHGFAAPVLHQHGVGAVFEQSLESLAGEVLFVSFDLDSVSGADAPGVSCPGTVGLTAQEALDMCFVAGRHPRVRLFDLSEFNPLADDYRTGRLVANMYYFFAQGLAQRQIDLQRGQLHH